MRIVTTQRLPASNLTIDTTHLLAVSKPDRFALRNMDGSFSTDVEVSGQKAHVEFPELTLGACKVRAESLGTIAICDGERTYSESAVRGVSGITEGAGDLEEILLALDFAPGHQGIARVVIGSLVGNTARDYLARAVEREEYRGVEALANVQCHVVRWFFKNRGQWDVFVDADEEPLLRAVRTDYTGTVEGGRDLTVTQLVEFSDWSIDGPIPDAYFTIPVKTSE
jgi:hypothetical protein